MPVICVNPTNSSEKEIVEQLSLQNADLRVFLSDQMEDSFNKSFPEKKQLETFLMILTFQQLHMVHFVEYFLKIMNQI